MFYAPAAITRKSPQKHEQPRIFAGLTDWVLLPLVALVAVVSGVVVGLQCYLAHLTVIVTSGQSLTTVERLATALDNNVLVVLLGWLGVPLLAMCLGFAMAQGSFSGTTLDYRLARIYERLATDGLQGFEAKIPASVTALLARFNQLLAQAQADTFARNALARTAFALSNSKKTEPDLAKQLDTTFGFRRLTAELVEETSRQGFPHTLTLRYTGVVNSSAMLPLEQPDLPLRLILFGEGIKVEPVTATVTLSGRGDSQALQFGVRFESKDAVVRVFSTAVGSAEVLQEFRLTFTAS